MKRILNAPLRDEDLADLRIGDVVYFNGLTVTCRDSAHRRLLQHGRELPMDLRGNAIFHAGPIVTKEGEDWNMVSIGPTTSMRMERFEKDFIPATGVKVIVGKGGMGADTAQACREHKAIHCVYPGGCAVLAAEQVEAVERVEWIDLGMPEALWVCRVKEFGPLIVSIDAEGRNLFQINRQGFEERKQPIVDRICEEVRFMG